MSNIEIIFKILAQIASRVEIKKVLELTISLKSLEMTNVLIRNLRPSDLQKELE